MKTIRHLLITALFAPLFCISVAADDTPPRPAAAEETRAMALLEKATAYYRTNGEMALPAFHRVGQFHDGDLYVYVLDTNGVMLTSGGSSSALIGRNVRDLRDPEGKPFFREILDTAATRGSGMIEYRWLNQQHGKVERKIAYFQAVGDRILIVGYYVPHASAEQAKAMLWRAVHEMKEYGPKAFEHFNDLNGGFIQDDLYVFVVGITDHRMYAHGAQPRLIRRDATDLVDLKGKPIIRQMLDIAKSHDEGELTYLWRNPVTGKDEKKRTYFKRVDNYLVAIGAYEP
jgi:cytochrome c